MDYIQIICGDAEADNLRTVSFVLDSTDLPREFFRIPAGSFVGSSQVYHCCDAHFQDAIQAAHVARPDCVLYY
jgi:hypothetical protein